MNIDRDLLTSFIVFAEELSFAHAAKRLHLSMPAVHVHVKRLSEALGVLLYERRGRALVLTPAGVSTLAHAREVTSIDARFRASLHGETVEAKLRVAAGEGTFLYLLGPTLAQLAKARISFAVDVLEGSAIEEAVLHGNADVGVGPLSRTSSALQSFRFARSHLALALPKSHPLSSKRKLRLRDLNGLPLILPPRGKPLREMIETQALGESVTLHASVEARHWPLALHLVQHGLGVAVVNDFCTPPRGVLLRKIEGPPSQDYFCFVRVGQTQNERLAALVLTLKEASGISLARGRGFASSRG